MRVSMKKLSLTIAAVLALLSLAGCAQYYGDHAYYGKGKAPPPAPPVYTKG
jgi:outer membrane protein assembly factor BamE (lipoprotein component of BamABCDE complex)